MKVKVETCKTYEVEVYGEAFEKLATGELQTDKVYKEACKEIGAVMKMPFADIGQGDEEVIYAVTTLDGDTLLEA